MPTLVDARALALAFEVLSGQTAAIDPGSVLIAAAAWVNFGSTPTITAFKRGGSGGTDITPAEADRDFFFGSSAIARGGVVLPSSASAETVYSSATGALQGAVAGAVYSDVASTHDWTSNEDVDGSGSTTVATLTIPNCVIDEKCAAIAFCASDSVNMAAFSGVAGTTINVQHVRAGEGFIAVVQLEKDVVANGNCILQVNCNTDTSAGMGWWIGGCAMTGAGGSTPIAGPRVGGFPLRSKLQGLVQ